MRATSLEKAPAYILPSKNSEMLVTSRAIQRKHIVPHFTRDGNSLTLLETTILQGAKEKISVDFHSIQILLPLVGDIRLASGQHLGAGEIWVQFFKKGTEFVFDNPYPSDSIHFLHIQIPFCKYVGSQLISFDFGSILHPLQKTVSITDRESLKEQFSIYLGKVDGRKDASLKTAGASLGFVVGGALEYQNCLLESGDSFWVGDSVFLEMEALSPEALILILEFAPDLRMPSYFS